MAIRMNMGISCASQKMKNWMRFKLANTPIMAVSRASIATTYSLIFSLM